MIVMKNGDEIPAKVFEIGDTEIKYKKCDNQNGPTYSLKKEDVLMVKYPNGSKDVFAQPKHQNGQQQHTYKTGNLQYGNEIVGKPVSTNRKMDFWSFLSFLSGMLMFLPYFSIGYYVLMALLALSYGIIG